MARRRSRRARRTSHWILALLFLSALIALSRVGLFPTRPGLDTWLASISGSHKDAESTLASLETASDVVVLDGHIARVVDGDTAELAGGETLRFLGIDTPERGGALFDEAGALNAELCAGEPLRIASPREKSRDRYDRRLAAIFASREGKTLCVNTALVRAGLARVYVVGGDPVTRAITPALVEAQRSAITERIGIWRDSRELEGTGLLATRWRFHRRDCRHIRERTGPLVAREVALRDGKSPCRSCRP